MMKFISKLTMVILAVVLFSCGEELFDTASRYADGLNLITALVQGASGGDVIVTDGRDYFRQWPVFASAPAAADRVFMDRRGRVFVAHSASDLYVYSGSEGWKSMPFGAVNGFSERDGESTIIMDEVMQVYEYSDGGLSPLIDLFSMSPQGIFMASGEGDTYVVDGSSSFFNLNNTSTLVAQVVGITNPTYYDRVDGIFYAGNTSIGLGSSESATIYSISAPWNAHSYAVISSREIYAGGTDNGTPVIFRINFSIAIPEFEIVYNGFSSVTGTVHIRVLDSGHLAVGIYGASAGDDGLYIFSTSDRKLRRVSSLPVWALYVRR